MNAYIHAIAADTHLTEEINVLIPNPAMRRRMGILLKKSVGTAMQCLRDAGNPSVDAIVTATGFGCLAESEQFLKVVLENDEQLLNPTPFIQSTFNTVGGQIALLTGNVSYNMTYTHRGRSFETAMLDAVSLIETGSADRVLLGAFDFKTPTLERILSRLGWPEGYAEGACFFVLDGLSEGALARVSLPEFPATTAEAEEILRGANAKVVEGCGPGQVYFPTQAACSLFDLLQPGKLQHPAVLYHHYLDDQPAILRLYPV